MHRFELKLVSEILQEGSFSNLIRPRFFKDDVSAHTFLVNFSKKSPTEHIDYGIDLLKNHKVLGHLKSIIFRELMNHPNISKEQIITAGNNLPKHYLLRGDMIHYERALSKFN
ncbi:MAG: hypothetical protein E6R13_04025 [Spirochaetes bacterium]|nr:MAG: hypothetical protein E6R13_04025 [Spirochaetota bacterium]